MADAVAAYPYLDGVGGGVVVHLLEAHIAVGEMVGVFVGIFVEHLLRGVVACGVYYELCEVWSAYLWRISGVEARRTLSDECRY